MPNPEISNHFTSILFTLKNFIPQWKSLINNTSF